MTLMMGAMLALRGVAMGLLTASFSFAVLVHAYIPMPIVAGPVWMLAAIGGHLVRKRQTGGGFSIATWASVAAIAAIFLVPFVWDAVLNPPGNAIRILMSAQGVSKHDSLGYILWGIYHNIVPDGRWESPAAIVLTILGLGTVCWWRGLRRDIAVVGILVTLVVSGMLVFMKAAPSPIFAYMTYFDRALFMFPLAVVSAMLVIHLWSRRLGCACLAGGGSLLLATLFIGTYPIPSRLLIPKLAQMISEEVPLGSMVRLVSLGDDLNNSRYEWPPSLVPSLMLALDSVGIRSCYPDPKYTYYFTPWRICPAAERLPTYGIKGGKDCAAMGTIIPLDQLRIGDVASMRTGLCLQLVRMDDR